SSTNGTFVDGTQISEIGLESGNRLQIGKTVLKVEFKDSYEIEREQALYEAATTDALTRVPNRRFFLERARAEWSAAKRANRWVHAAILDVDFFKKVNDTWGHAAGDFVLREVANILGKIRREEDLLARWGGEEFVFLLSGIEPVQALAFAERARQTVASHRFVWEENLIQVTVSIGMAHTQVAQSSDLDALISLADVHLYQAKRAGRNQVQAE
ncbi:MAG TPA: GGDEF domain-containing protein, partial [Fibrobacteraceae bacterium]|nr:GGDEF domain-containing protein [Fibrobacteraceae bacterium]